MTSLLSILSVLPFYLIGCFPSGYLIAKAQGIDIRSVGSGNVGATNVARVVGKKAGIATLVLDLLKGFLSVFIASLLSSEEWFPIAAGVAAVCGHCFSIPPILKGGKGVATALGAILALNAAYAGVAVAVFLSVFGLSRIVSLSSIAAALSVPFCAFFGSANDSLAAALTAISLIVVYRHKENIKRISEGREPRFGKRPTA